jgi:hypothetical protein
MRREHATRLNSRDRRATGFGDRGLGAVRSPAMLEFQIQHDFDISAEKFWEKFMDKDFTRELIITGLGFGRCEVEPTQERDGKQYRTMYVEPKLDVPSAVAKLLGPKLGYTENANLDPAAGVWTFVLRLSVLSERIRLGGTMRIEPLDDDRCRRITDLWTEAKIPAIGKLVERAAEKNLRDGWGKSAVWMSHYFEAEA